MKSVLKTAFILVGLHTVLSAQSTVILFYKEALKTLSYQNTYTLQQKSRALSIEAKKKQRYLNLDAGMMYGTTDAKLLPHHFNTTDISITDTIDLFGKNVEEIHLIQLQMKEDRLLLQVQKEKLFLSLLNMITAYRMSEEKWHRKKKFYKKQVQFLIQLKSAVHAGAISKLELTRFENTMALFKVQLDKEEQVVTMMKAQLKLYSPHHAVPQLSSTRLHSNFHRFLSRSPQLKLNDNRAKQASQKIKQIEQSWIPDTIIGANQQFNDDPTANGDNYTLSMGLSMHFNGGMSHDIERQKVDALKIRSQKKALEIKRKAQYIAWKSDYETDRRSLDSLNKTLKKTEKTLQNVRTAYLQHYIDLNSYLQMMQENLTIQDAKITAKYNMIKSVIILNTLSKGTIYK